MSSSHPHVLVLTPAWNERETVGDTVTEIFTHNPSVDVLVVDDGSRDDTAAVAARAGAQVLRLPYNMGVGGALRAGFKYAVQHNYTTVIQVDADGQHDPRDIPRVLKGLERADISIGARFTDKDDYKVSGPRRWAMVVLAKTISPLAGTHLTDITSGFRAANQKALFQYLEHFPAEYLGDTVDSLVVALRSGCTATQVPVKMRTRQGGSPSQSAVKSGVYLFRSIFALIMALARSKTYVPTFKDAAR